MQNIKFIATTAYLFIAFVLTAKAQTTSQKIGENSTVKNEGAVLELESANKGVLFPRVALSSTTAWGLAGTATRGMLVYNTKTTTDGFTGSTAYPVAAGDGTGLYFWDGTGWAAAARVSASGADLTKDAWVDDSANKQVILGTKSDGTTRPADSAFVIKDDAKVGIGTSSPVWQLDIQGDRAIGHFKRFTGNSAFNVAPAILLARSRGTSTSEANVQGGDFLGKIQFRGRVNSNAQQDSDFGTFAYIANSTSKGDGRFAFLKESGENLATSEVMSINTNTGNVGIGTRTPQSKLHVNGPLQVTNELNVGGDAATAGSAGSSGQVLVSNGANAAPEWKTLSQIPGTIAKVYSQQGTAAGSVAVTTTSTGSPIDVPGLSFSHTVPAGTSQTLLFTITGYVVLNSNTNLASIQGSFWLLQDGTKISSAFASAGDGGNLNNLPHPCTLLKSVTLSGGSSGTTYTFKVQYKAWAGTGNHIVNNNPTKNTGGNIDFNGADSNDTEAMLSKMQVLVYNN